MKRITAVWLAVLAVVCINLPAFGQVQKGTAEISAGMFVKTVKYEKTLSSRTKNLIVYVQGDEELAALLQNAVGEKIGKTTIGEVRHGSEIPDAFRPDILFINDMTHADLTVKFTRMNKILSVTSDPEIFAKGVTLLIGRDVDDRPKLMIDINASKEEKLDWNSAIMKVALVKK